MPIQDNNGQNGNTDGAHRAAQTGANDSNGASFDKAFAGHANQLDLVDQADDLKGLLQQIAKQIADVDQRHSVSLRDMHERLAVIGERAEQVGADVPTEFQPAFDRIGDAVTQLSDRLSQAGTERTARHDGSAQSADQPDQASLSDQADQADQTDQASQGEQSQVSHFSLQLEKELQELKSTLTKSHDGSDAGASPTVVSRSEAVPADEEAQDYEQEQGREQANSGPTQTAQEAQMAPLPAPSPAPSLAMVPETSIAADPAQPWDADAVSALADLYASGEDGLPPTRLRDPDQSDENHDVIAAAPQGLQDTNIDQTWLEARFADVAARVEMSLADVQNRFSMEDLGARFDQLEDRIAVALEEAAAQPDAEGLSAIEGHLADLTSHVQETQTQLARLDGIEDQIGEVVRQLSAQGDIVSAFDMPSSQPDIHEIAETVANRFASKLADERPPADTAEAAQQLSGLQTLLEGYMDERREGEKNTSGALDTMQSALIHLLERVDSMELSIADAPALQGAAAINEPEQANSRTEQNAAAASRPIANGQAASGDLQTFAAHAARDGRESGIAAEPAAPSEAGQGTSFVQRGDSAVNPAYGAAKGADPRAPLANNVPAREHGGAVSGVEKKPKIEAPTAQQPEIAQTETVQTGRDDFIAQARRAQKLADGQGPHSERRDQLVAKSHEKLDSRGDNLDSRGGNLGSRSDNLGSRGDNLDGRSSSIDPADLIGDGGLRSRLSGSGSAATPARPQGRSAATSSLRDLALEPGAMPQAANIKQAAHKSSKAMPKPLLLACAGLAVVTMGTLLYGKINANSKTTGALTSQIETPREAVAKSIAARAEAAKSQGDNSQAARAQAASRAQMQRSTMPPATGLDNPRPARAMPSKMTEDSSLMPGQIPSSTAPAGITVHNSRRKLSAAAMQRIIDGQTRAELSARLAEQGGPDGSGGSGSSGGPVSKASLTPQSALLGNSDLAAAGLPQGKSNRALNMPPAIVGPLSLRLAAAKGDPSAEFEVAARYAEGKGIKQDYSQAVKWYKRSAARGFAPAQYRLGTLYERGMGVDTDLSRSRIWYLRAAKQGNVKAMHNLAVLSAGRSTGAPDYATAVQWFTEAGERGLADSQFNLGILYQSGLGVVANTAQSYKWFSLAATHGDKQAAVRADALRRQMTPAQLTGAERLVRGWRQTPVERLVNDPHAAGRAWSSTAYRPKSAG